jgi:hypothetical protein
MGAKILLHFSKDTLTNFPLIIDGYRQVSHSRAAANGAVTQAKPLESVEENFSSLEEISSSAS